jgi:inward rectifier potassium channel
LFKRELLKHSLLLAQSGCDTICRVSAVEKPTPDIDSDLGFGAVVARESRKRLLNKDGTFNVRREGLPFLKSLAVYHYLLNITSAKFLGYVIAAYVATNALFAACYVACGPDALSGFGSKPMPARFSTAFFFSVHTLATIGYGNIAPGNTAANVVVTVEALFGLLGFSVVAGIVFARFSRPVARILFSSNAVIAPYRGGRAFMFRIVNQKSNEIVELRAKLMLAQRRKGVEGERDFIRLKLERESVVFFPLTWTVVHPIDESSPLWGADDQKLRELGAEFLVLLNGFDETYSQTVHTRSSYTAQEIVWNARFTSIFNPPQKDGTLSVDIRKLHDFERVNAPV